MGEIEPLHTAIVLSEKSFGKLMGKTANGLVRYSKKYKILGVIDSTKAGKDSGEVLDGKKNGIYIYNDIEDCLKNIPQKPDFIIIGIASVGGTLPREYRPIIRKAIENKINIISGLHEFLTEDEEFSRLAHDFSVDIFDIRKSKDIDKFHIYSDKVKDIDAIRIPILGTDSSIGKRTTAILLTEALNNLGMKTSLIATGQTGLLQGIKYGFPLDATPYEFVAGELENSIVMAYENEKPKIIIIEGQGSISHPAYVCGSPTILLASRPNAVILQHAPKRALRRYRRNELHLPMPKLDKEMEMIEMLSGANVVAITINHENMTEEDVKLTIEAYENKYSIPVCDVLLDGCSKIINELERRISLAVK